jgi:hypothetical protein
MNLIAADLLAPFFTRMLAVYEARLRYEAEPTPANRARRTGAEQAAFDALQPARPHMEADTYTNLIVTIPSVTGSVNPNGIRVFPRRRTA